MLSGDFLQKVFDYIWQFVPQPKIVGVRHKGLKTQTFRFRDLFPRAWWDESVQRWIFAWTPFDLTAKLMIIEPGLTVVWPAVTEWDDYPVKEQTLPVIGVEFETVDGVTMRASGVLVYDVADVLKLLTETYDADDGMADTTRALLLQVLEKRSRNQLRKNRRALNNELVKVGAAALMDRFGIRVKEFNLDSLTPVRVYRVVQSTRHEGELK
jgi:regulator of protease activity HflC (stomatin/prohibitin superfamily)